jgi:hypothetical protein
MAVVHAIARLVADARIERQQFAVVTVAAPDAVSTTTPTARARLGEYLRVRVSRKM